MNLIVAVDEEWGIGKEGGLLARLPGDMRYFRETTRGKVVVMGRKTLESFPGQKPLKNRVNLVLTKNREYAPEGVRVCHDVEETLKALEQYPQEDIFIIGGGMIYREFFPFCRKAYVTFIHSVFGADTGFVNLDLDRDWEEEGVGELQEDGGLCYEFRTYVRRLGK